MAFVHRIQQRINQPAYRSYQSRLDTYGDNWFLMNLCQSAESLAYAGFFRINDYNDVVQCFACEVKLHAWEPSDDPLLEHEKWSPSCWYVAYCKRQMVMLIYILPLITMVERSSALRRDPQKCTQCQIDDISIKFWPCQCRLTCTVCSIPLVNCPRCHVHILQKSSIYHS